MSRGGELSTLSSPSHVFFFITDLSSHFLISSCPRLVFSHPRHHRNSIQAPGPFCGNYAGNDQYFPMTGASQRRKRSMGGDAIEKRQYRPRSVAKKDMTSPQTPEMENESQNDELQDVHVGVDVDGE